MRSSYEIKAQKELEAEGWYVDYKARPFRVPKGYKVDFLGVFDLLAYKPGLPLRMISIKGHAGVPGAHRRELEAMLFSSGIIKELWIYRDKLGVKKETIL